MRGPRHGLALVTWALVAALVGGCAALGFETADSVMKEGQQLYLDKKYDEAIMKFERVLELDSTRWLAYVYLARCYMAKGSWTKAMSNARLAYGAAPAGEDVVPTLTQALWGGGLDALKSGQYRDAISAFTEYVRLRPSDASGYLELGRAFMQQGSIADAIANFGKSLQLNPNNPDASNLLRGLR